MSDTITRDPIKRVYLAGAAVGATVVAAATALGLLGLAIGL